MTVHTLKPEEIGPFILQFCLEVIPCDQGDEAFSWITHDWGGGGTTCGFLCHAAMWLAGVRGGVVNFSDPTTRKGYINGHNIIRIFNVGRPPFTLHKQGKVPVLGSILFVSNGPSVTEHVEILKEINPDGTWTVYAGGQQNENGKECMRARTRPFDGVHLGNRKLVGYIQPHNLIPTAEAIDVVHFLSDRSARVLRDPFTGKPF